MQESIIYKDEEIAVLFRKVHSVSGVAFLTDDDDTLQVGLLRRVTGQVAAPRRRSYTPQTVDTMQQTIYVIEGALEITLYDQTNEEIISVIEMHVGDVIFLRKHAHGVKFTQDSLILETKQGPYPGNQSGDLLKGYQEGASHVIS